MKQLVVLLFVEFHVVHRKVYPAICDTQATLDVLTHILDMMRLLS